jgi:triacylglycerol lipase
VIVARTARNSLILESVCWILLAAVAHWKWGWSAYAAIGGMVAGIVGLRVALVATTFAIAIAHSPELPPGLRVSLIGGARTFYKETFWLGLTYGYFIPFDQIFLRGDRLGHAEHGRSPILLVHGYGCNRGVWVYLARVLHKAGWPVTTINLEPPRISMDDFADQLSKRIREVLDETGAERLILVCHSMGGLVARRYLAKYGESFVHAVVTLGTPHHGTELARFGTGDCARQMELGSEWLARLPSNLRVPLVAIYSAHDNFVIPTGPCRLAGARNIAVPGVGHVHMLFSHRIANHLLRELAGVR